jgi:hypothetical protein
MVVATAATGATGATTTRTTRTTRIVTRTIAASIVIATTATKATAATTAEPATAAAATTTTKALMKMTAARWAVVKVTTMTATAAAAAAMKAAAAARAAVVSARIVVLPLGTILLELLELATNDDKALVELASVVVGEALLVVGEREKRGAGLADAETLGRNSAVGDALGRFAHFFVAELGLFELVDLVEEGDRGVDVAGLAELLDTSHHVFDLHGDGIFVLGTLSFEEALLAAMNAAIAVVDNTTKNPI